MTEQQTPSRPASEPSQLPPLKLRSLSSRRNPSLRSYAPLSAYDASTVELLYLQSSLATTNLERKRQAHSLRPQHFSYPALELFSHPRSLSKTHSSPSFSLSSTHLLSQFPSPPTAAGHQQSRSRIPAEVLKERRPAHQQGSADQRSRSSSYSANQLHLGRTSVTRKWENAREFASSPRRSESKPRVHLLHLPCVTSANINETRPWTRPTAQRTTGRRQRAGGASRRDRKAEEALPWNLKGGGSREIDKEGRRNLTEGKDKRRTWQSVSTMPRKFDSASEAHAHIVHREGRFRHLHVNASIKQPG